MLVGGVGYGLAKQQQMTRVTETQMLLGSVANLTLISHQPEKARQAIAAAFGKMSALEDVFSRFRPNSQLSQLNAKGHLQDAHPAFVDVMAKAIHYGDLSSGAFDVSVEPVLRLYRQGSQSGTMPSDDQIAAAQQTVDYRQISLAPDSISLSKPGMAITLDGIAKGYIIDAGAAVLRDHGFEHILVELGGDLQAYGDADQRPWHVRIERPRSSSSAPIMTSLENRAMATSGDYQNAFTPDLRLHHIIDPTSGISPGELASATVIAPTACDADALSTTMLVMGTQADLALIEQLPTAEALLITKAGQAYTSANFPAST